MGLVLDQKPYVQQPIFAEISKTQSIRLIGIKYHSSFEGRMPLAFPVHSSSLVYFPPSTCLCLCWSLPVFLANHILCEAWQIIGECQTLLKSGGAKDLLISSVQYCIYACQLHQGHVFAPGTSSMGEYTPPTHLNNNNNKRLLLHSHSF